MLSSMGSVWFIELTVMLLVIALGVFSLRKSYRWIVGTATRFTVGMLVVYYSSQNFSVAKDAEK
tara:strand:+ start:1533 stop:1724 length:192 start_codon:yes stop_codon:yes gene_type:complete